MHVNALALVLVRAIVHVAHSKLRVKILIKTKLKLRAVNRAVIRRGSHRLPYACLLVWEV